MDILLLVLSVILLSLFIHVRVLVRISGRQSFSRHWTGQDLWPVFSVAGNDGPFIFLDVYADVFTVSVEHHLDFFPVIIVCVIQY